MAEKTPKTGKIKQISLREQISRDRIRVKLKQGERKGKPFRMPQIPIGNKDFGVPYRGKDVYGGMLKKFADRFIPNYEKPGVGRVFVYDNNKYNADGTLKD